MGIPYPSKVTLPARRPPIVRRQRLIEALAEAVEHRIGLVSAPAGYGKTTLLMDFAQSCEQPVCWYALDERDRDLGTFLRYFLAAGQCQFPAFGAELAETLAEGGEIAPEDATDLLVAAAQSVTDPYVFILDDFHFLDDGPQELRDAIGGWLYRLPPNCHVIISGRTRPQLGILPLMSVRQEVEAITAIDFSFTCEEVVQLFRDVLGQDVTLDDAQHLANVTEGWAAALVLLADRVQLSRTSISLEHLRRSDTLAQYISLEQFDPQPDDVKQFLMGSGVLRRMDLETVNELLEITDTEERLNYLERMNLFVLREAQGRYRYQRLFRAYLVSHLRALDPQRFRELNVKAGSLREQQEDWGEAVYHYIQSAAWDRIVQVTERVGARMFEEGHWDTLADWLEAVPAEELSSRPKLVLWKARILHHLNQIDRALSLLAQAIVGFEAGQDWASLAEALVTKGMCLRAKGDYQESKEALAKARALLMKHDGPTSSLTDARKELGITLSLCGELNPSIKELSGVLEVFEAQGDTYNIAHTSDRLASTLGLAGRLAEGTTYLEQSRQRWMKLGNDHRLVETLINLSMMYYLQGDYPNAGNVIQQGLEIAQRAGSARPEVYLMATLGDVKRDQGEHAEALRLYNQALDQAWTLDDAYVRIYITDSIANAYRLSGDITNAESWARRAMAEAENAGGALELGVCLVTAGLLKRYQGDLKEAVEELERATSYLKDADAKRELSAAYFHLAGAYFSLKRKRFALDYLELASKLAGELGYDHFLLVEAAHNPLLIQYAAANKLADGYYARILKLVKGSSGPSTTSDDGGEISAAEAATAVHAFGLGQPRAEIGGQEISDLEWRSEKSKEMFFFFLCNRRPLRKEEIVAALWPDLPDAKTTSAFHSNMYRLRKALYQDCIAKDSGRYVLDPRGKFLFDVEEFQQALQTADAAKGSAESIAFMEKALELYKGQFAPDFYSEWAETLRWQLEEQFTSLLSSLASAYLDAQEYKKSADICQRIVELDEFNEAAWYRLMSSYVHSGQLEAAKYCYSRYVQVLARDEDFDAADVSDFDTLCQEITSAR